MQILPKDAYLIVFGSPIFYTAYVWLLARIPATRVASHAYVNPLVAVSLGYFLAGEELTARMLTGALIIVGSVFPILTSRSIPVDRARRLMTTNQTPTLAPR